MNLMDREPLSLMDREPHFMQNRLMVLEPKFDGFGTEV